MLSQRRKSKGPVNMIRGTLHACKGASILQAAGYLDRINIVLLFFHSYDLKLCKKRLYTYFHSIHLISLNWIYVHFGL